MRPLLSLAAVFFLLVSAPALRAQGTPDSTAASTAPAIFAYVQLTDTVGYEAITSDSLMVRGMFLVPGQGRIGWDHWLLNDKPTRLRLTWYPDGDVLVRAAREAEYELKGDSMLVITRDAERTEREMRSTSAEAIPAFGRSMTHVAYLAFHAVQSRLASLPLFLTSSGKTVVASIEVMGEIVVVTVDGLRIETEWIDGALSEIRVPSQGLTVRRVRVVTN